MATKVTFAQIQSYLDAIANTANGDITRSPHQQFWRVSYQAFITGNVPGRPDPVTHQPRDIIDQTTHLPVPIIAPGQPGQSGFFMLLNGPWHGFHQMPDGGPVVKDSSYTIGGSVVAGTKILSDLSEWLTNDFPENGNA